jgi:hypothetical protein
MMRDHVQACIEACREAHRICMETVTYLPASSSRVAPEGIRLLFNCAEVCQMSATLLRDGWELNGRTGAISAEVCEESARYCDGLGEDPRIRDCAEACRRCAETCHRLAAVAA